VASPHLSVGAAPWWESMGINDLFRGYS
jgi:hypothetical protein